MNSTIADTANGVSARWKICCQEFPRGEIIYLSQVILIYIIVCACVVNLSIGGQENPALWSSLLSGALGYLLPSPSLNKMTETNFKQESTHLDFLDGRLQQEHTQ